MFRIPARIRQGLALLPAAILLAIIGRGCG